MLRQTWNAYRGWAKAARDLQSQTQRWNLAALICVIAAAVFGAIASVAPTTLSAWVAGAAAVASAVGAYLGRQIVGSGEEAGWIQARATAEGIKSECYRYAARAGVYAVADADAAKALAADTAAIAKQATDKGLVRADDPVPVVRRRQARAVRPDDDGLVTRIGARGSRIRSTTTGTPARGTRQPPTGSGGSPSRRASRRSRLARSARLAQHFAPGSAP